MRPFLVHEYEDGRQCEFSLMSKGLGKNYLTDDMISWHQKDVLQRAYCNLEDGKKVAMPRYYRERVYKWWQRNMIAEECVKRVDKKVVKELVNRKNVNYFRNEKERHARDFRVMEGKNKKNVI